MQYDIQEHTSLQSLTWQQQQFGGGGGSSGPTKYQKKMDKQSQKNQEEALKLQKEMLAFQQQQAEDAAKQTRDILAFNQTQFKEQRSQFQQQMKFQQEQANRVSPAIPTNYGPQAKGSAIQQLERRRNQRGLSTTLRAGNTGRVNTRVRTLTEAR